MKARIKATGKVIEAIPRYYNINGDPNLDRLYYLPEEVELIEDKEINWEQRTWEAAVAIMQGLMSDDISTCRLQADAASKEVDFTAYVARVAIDFSKALVAEYRKGE